VRLGERLARMPPALRAAVVLVAVFVALLVVFVATGEHIGSAVAQAAFWAILAVFAAVVGRALGVRRRRDPPQ
jgi:peptidoglycan/LPS O-acetylase OafA/YrhL